MYKVEVELRTQGGLHARPAGLFVKVSSKYSSTIKIVKDAKEFNAKSIMGILSMGAVKGEKLTIIAEGKDEKDAVTELKALFDNNFDK